jgi:fructose-1,6-bisphosphatase
MRNKERVLKTCILSVVLVFIFLSFTGCVEKGKEVVNVEDASLVIEGTNGNLEQLKLERDKIMQKIKESKEIKSINPIMSENEMKENIKKLDKLSEDLLEQSKEIEEKIKTIQQNNN